MCKMCKIYRERYKIYRKVCQLENGQECGLYNLCFVGEDNMWQSILPISSFRRSPPLTKTLLRKILLYVSYVSDIWVKSVHCEQYVLANQRNILLLFHSIHEKLNKCYNCLDVICIVLVQRSDLIIIQEILSID